MTFLPSNVHTAACSSSSTLRRKCVPFCLSCSICSVRYESWGRADVCVAIIPPKEIHHGDTAGTEKTSWMFIRVNPYESAAAVSMHAVGVQQNLAGFAGLEARHAFAEILHGHAIG